MLIGPRDASGHTDPGALNLYNRTMREMTGASALVPAKSVAAIEYRYLKCQTMSDSSTLCVVPGIYVCMFDTRDTWHCRYMIMINSKCVTPCDWRHARHSTAAVKEGSASYMDTKPVGKAQGHRAAMALQDGAPCSRVVQHQDGAFQRLG